MLSRISCPCGLFQVASKTPSMDCAISSQSIMPEYICGDISPNPSQVKSGLLGIVALSVPLWRISKRLTPGFRALHALICDFACKKVAKSRANIACVSALALGRSATEPKRAVSSMKAASKQGWA